nr:glutathione peroxidase [Chitinophagales bacterium]
MENLPKNTIYKFTATSLEGKEIALSEYAGRVLLIVNTATHCGHVGQLQTLENVYQQYKEQGFEILGFPSNQFANQEPLEGKAIGEFCTTNYGVSFQLFDKINVRGRDAHPLFKFFGDKKQ